MLDTVGFFITLFLGSLLCLMGMVAGIVLAEYRIRIKARLKELEEKEKRATNIVVDAISFDIDVWNCEVSLSLFMDTEWKKVADINFPRLHVQNIPSGERFIHSTTPIKAFKDAKSPLRFGDTYGSDSRTRQEPERRQQTAPALLPSTLQGPDGS